MGNRGFTRGYILRVAFAESKTRLRSFEYRLRRDLKLGKSKTIKDHPAFCHLIDLRRRYYIARKEYLDFVQKETRSIIGHVDAEEHLKKTLKLQSEEIVKLRSRLHQESGVSSEVAQLKDELSKSKKLIASLLEKNSLLKAEVKSVGCSPAKPTVELTESDEHYFRRALSFARTSAHKGKAFKIDGLDVPERVVFIKLRATIQQLIEETFQVVDIADSMLYLAKPELCPKLWDATLNNFRRMVGLADYSFMSRLQDERDARVAKQGNRLKI